MLSAAAANFAEPNAYPVDGRGLAYTYAYVGIKRLGAGQFYLINIKDKDGKTYDGANTYRVHVPPHVPVEQYWSLTVYDFESTSRNSIVPESPTDAGPPLGLSMP